MFPILIIQQDLQFHENTLGIISKMVFIDKIPTVQRKIPSSILGGSSHQVIKSKLCFSSKDLGIPYCAEGCTYIQKLFVYRKTFLLYSVGCDIKNFES